MASIHGLLIVRYDLLVTVKRAHPEVNAVSCGAIFSDYQRLRVENVCQRLGLMVILVIGE